MNGERTSRKGLWVGPGGRYHAGMIEEQVTFTVLEDGSVVREDRV